MLRLASRIGDNLLAMQTETGLFPRAGRKWGRVGDPVPLALLHLAATIEGERDAIPAAVVDRYRFHARWEGDPLHPDQQRPGDSRTFDDHVYFGPIETGAD